MTRKEREIVAELLAAAAKALNRLRLDGYRPEHLTQLKAAIGNAAKLVRQ